MDEQQLKNIVEGALLAAGRALTTDDLLGLFEEKDGVTREQLRSALEALEQEYESRGVRLKEVASGFRLQVKTELSEWVSRLWMERPSRYSRALLETLALVAYRQPITRGEIEDIRGVSVSSSIMKTLQEREWVRVVGHRDVPGKPAMYATTRTFLDYFDLKSLDELPPLAELRDIDSINAELDLEGSQADAGHGEAQADGSAAATDDERRAGEADEQAYDAAGDPMPDEAAQNATEEATDETTDEVTDEVSDAVAEEEAEDHVRSSFDAGPDDDDENDADADSLTSEDEPVRENG